MASHGCLDWNRIEEWLRRMERLRISLEAGGNIAYYFSDHGLIPGLGRNIASRLRG